MFDLVVCLNLDRRRDRWVRFVRGMPTDWPFSRPRRYAAVDGATLPIPLSDWPPGAWGCLRSHVRIWEEALWQKLDAILVLEDDALFCEGFSQRVQDFLAAVPGDWDQLYFGGEHMTNRSPAPRVVGDLVLRCTDVNRTHAYAIRASMLAAAYQKLAVWPPKGMPLTRLDYHVDHKLGELHRSGDWNVYAPREWLVGQATGRSDVMGRKPLPTKWWNGFRVREPVAC